MMSYEIMKALHLISMVAWFAALFYLPRLFVYHTDAPKEAHDMLCIMERRLYRFIMTPAMIATWIFGFMLIYLEPNWLMQGGWLHAKLTCVVLLSAFHGMCGKYVRIFAAGENTKSDRFFRLLNEVPTVLLIAIIFLAVLKPF